MYKKALQMKLRFKFRGPATVEDLFDLNLKELDEVYRDLVQHKSTADEGLLQSPTKEDEVLALKLEIVKDVFLTKKAEADERKAAADRKAQKERIMEIIADKQDEALMGKSLEELTAMLDAL